MVDGTRSFLRLVPSVISSPMRNAFVFVSQIKVGKCLVEKEIIRNFASHNKCCTKGVTPKVK